jgi:hypothetical protein
MKTHFRNIRLRNNAGMDFPECKAYQEYLDLDSGRWPTTGNQKDVTCKNCIKMIKKQWFNSLKD